MDGKIIWTGILERKTIIEDHIMVNSKMIATLDPIPGPATIIPLSKVIIYRMVKEILPNLSK